MFSVRELLGAFGEIDNKMKQTEICLLLLCNILTSCCLLHWKLMLIFHITSRVVLDILRLHDQRNNCHFQYIAFVEIANDLIF